MTQPAEPRMFRQRPDGLLEVDTPAGPLPVNATPEQLTAAGLRPADSVSQIPGLAGTLSGNIPATDEQRARETAVGAGIDNSAGLAALRGGAQPIAIERPKPSPTAARESSSLRDGGAVKQVNVTQGEQPGFALPPSGPRPRFVKGGDQRVGFSVARTGLRREDIDAAEEAEADASIDRKLSAQNISERQTSRVEQASAEYGRQIRQEGEAIRAQEERNHAMRQEYDKRLASIEMARDRAAKLEDAPTVHWKDDNSFAGIIAKIAVLAAGLTGSDPRLAIGELDKEFDRSVAQKREKWERARTAMKDEQDEFGQLVAVFGSPQAAEEELRDRQRMYVQSIGQKMALDAGAVDAADTLRATFADWDDQRAQSRLAREQAIAGNITEQFAYQPDRFIGGAPKVKEEDVKALSSREEAAKILEREEESGMIRDIISQLPEGEIPTKATRNFLSRGVRDTLDYIGGQGTAQSALDSDAERSAARLYERATSAMRTKMLGAAQSDAELANFQRTLDNTTTRKGLVELNQEIDRALERRKAGIRAGHTADVVQEYERRKGAYNLPARAPGQRSER